MNFTMQEFVSIHYIYFEIWMILACRCPSRERVSCRSVLHHTFMWEHHIVRLDFYCCLKSLACMAPHAFPHYVVTNSHSSFTYLQVFSFLTHIFNTSLNDSEALKDL